MVRGLSILTCAVLLSLGPIPVAAAAPAGAVCDHLPATAPAAPVGAVVVRAADNELAVRTQESPSGTTFWLGPGTYTLGGDPYGQVAPKDGDTYLGAPGAVLDGRGTNMAAFTGRARDVTIRGLTVRGFAAPQDQGVVNHDSGDGWVIENNTIEDNRGAGLMAGARQVVRGNCLRDNGQYGLNAYQSGDGITGLVVEGNEIAGNNTDDWETRVPGCGCSGGAKFWAVNGADIQHNWVHGNHGPGLWADTNDNDFLIADNTIEDNDAEAVFYEISYNLVLRDNVFRRNNIVAGKARAARGDNFPSAAVYLSESGGEPRVPARTSSVQISGNTFEDNWSGITLWENADRFCDSPANTSSGYCTLLVRDRSTCVQPGIATRPLYDDCRWKTQRVAITGNTFRVSDALCGDGLCARMAILSNYGSYPDWSPYRGTVVQDAILSQGNVWRGNTYSGAWTYVPHDTSRRVSAAEWQSAYGQDACSSFTGAAPSC